MLKKDWAIAFLVMLAAFAAHAIYVPGALGRMHSDYAIYWLLTEDALAGKLHMFTLQQAQGGTLLANLLRVLWIKLYWLFGGATDGVGYIRGMQVFTFGVMPALLAGSAFAFLRTYFKRPSAFLASLLLAFGLSRLVRDLFITDYHWGYVLTAMILFAIRGKSENPVLEHTLPRLIAAGVLCGFALYSGSIAAVFVVAYWVPWRASRGFLSALYRDRDASVVWLRRIAHVLAGFGLFVYIFNENLGLWYGHPVKLHALPNFKFAIVALALASTVKLYRKAVFSDFVAWAKRGSVLIGAVLVGLWPQLYHFAFLRQGTSSGYSTQLQSWSGVCATVARLPQTIKEFFSADADSILFVPYLVFAVASAVGLFRMVNKNRLPEAFVAAFILSLLAYIFGKTYAEDAPARYLFPILIPWLAGAAALFDWLMSQRSWGWIVSTLVVASLGAGQLSVRAALARSSQGKEAEYLAVRDCFRRENIRVVQSDDYLRTNVFSAISRKKPIFLAPQPNIEPFEGRDLLRSEKRIGILLPEGVPVPPGFKLTPLCSVRGYRLFVGEKG